MKREYKNLEEFYQHLEEPNSDYPWFSKDLLENPTLEQRLKFKICQKIIDYKLKNKLTAEQLAEIIFKDWLKYFAIELIVEKIKKVLFCWIEEFELKELTDCVNHLRIETLSKQKKIENEPLTNQPPKWSLDLNDRKIIEIVEKRLSNKFLEPLPEPLLLWNKEVYFLETAHHRVKYKMIFELEGMGIKVRNIWVISHE
ncbi:MAG: hypothetical protein MRERC_2c023 [Mycoplasmataceae bacterium RC_NB112A]|nr:MAG: hypothetical protein MRERC_6c077 [Mycoplasmataceae bacterium RC_NB112A]KLL02148.1 MAG: hypothetical protein MRERC_4c113 [Mycoplasmataceae bacterium RC_NB112A]KLL02162.1 MAG: hypothetical protein MRERC_4c130 [Mycoplasmataceae bacterium RC_NB112A]KLL02308.1 MAG: hypothetical protein MRERC_2c023 [Mycoplasmataceae bacterium RC_NB112A]